MKLLYTCNDIITTFFYIYLIYFVIKCKTENIIFLTNFYLIFKHGTELEIGLKGGEFTMDCY
jgi:hypothetical protein